MKLLPDTLLTAEQVRQLSPTSLAYVGDAVYELWVRLYFLLPQKQMHAYHQQVVEKVRAENQADLLSMIAPMLTEEEWDVVRRGRNSVTKAPKRLNHSIYRQATGFETLLGYLYLKDSKRLSEIFSYVKLIHAGGSNTSQTMSPIPSSHHVDDD